MFSRIKDAALEKAILLVVKPKLERYGEIRSLNLDTTEKVISGEIKLIGEPIPVSISEAHYNLEKVGEDNYLIVTGIKVSREWAQNILDDHFPAIRLKIPEYLVPLIA
jgi:hypothetical protein